ncbi:MAG: hydrogenase maturation protease [bacterium]|nr:hydrogenase maturation protease [bacterium]
MEASKETSILVIGYGNPARCDDGIGEYVTERLLSEGINVDILTCQELGPELCEDISGCGLVFFIDAGIEQNEAFLIREITPKYKTPIFSHHISPEMLLAITEELYNVRPKAYLVSIKGYNFDFGFEITEMAKQNSERAIEKIKEICMSWQSQKR